MMWLFLDFDRCFPVLVVLSQLVFELLLLLLAVPCHLFLCDEVAEDVLDCFPCDLPRIGLGMLNFVSLLRKYRLCHGSSLYCSLCI